VALVGKKLGRDEVFSLNSCCNSINYSLNEEKNRPKVLEESGQESLCNYTTQDHQQLSSAPKQKHSGNYHIAFILDRIALHDPICHSVLIPLSFSSSTILSLPTFCLIILFI
jgi:hypothetical protein